MGNEVYVEKDAVKESIDALDNTNDDPWLCGQFNLIVRVPAVEH